MTIDDDLISIEDIFTGVARELYKSVTYDYADRYVMCTCPICGLDFTSISDNIDDIVKETFDCYIAHTVEWLDSRKKEWLVNGKLESRKK